MLWQSPQDVGWAPAINYTLTISPGHVPLTTRITSAQFTLLYNVLHNVSIVATNICGSSNAVMEVIPAIGMYFLTLFVVHPVVKEGTRIGDIV